MRIDRYVGADIREAMMARPGIIVMAIITWAVGLATFSGLVGGRELFAPQSVTDARLALENVDRG